MKTVLVTGGAGYIGSAVVLELAARGYRPVVYDDLVRGHRAAVTSFDLVQGKIGDQLAVAAALERYQVSAVIHLAACSQVGESVAHPGIYFANNVAEGIQFFNTVREHGVNHLVLSSSAAVYGHPEHVPIAESHPIRPINPYGETKVMLERVLQWYDAAYGLRSVSLRYFNAAGAVEGGVIGEDHNPETHLIPILMAVALGQRPMLDVYGTDYSTPDGTAIRDYIHVEDLAVAHVLALEAMMAGMPSTALNLGSGIGYSVAQVVSAAEEMLGRRLPVSYKPRRAGDPPVLVADSTRAHLTLGWKPAKSGLEHILQTAWKWHSTHPHGYRTESALSHDDG